MTSLNFKTKDNVFRINTYSISTNIKHIIGKGAYGIVYKATDSKYRTIAAKTINGKLHPRILKQDLSKLVRLDHENVVKIHDFHKQDETFWMFMELCCYGDLNDFFHKKKLDLDEKLELMHGIAEGIAYLHDNNIIHRDIKPGNILIACDSPLIPKLTDFDLSKSLDPDFETSVMSSNVGTLAYKAPEFFNRIDGKLRYHRNVDVYAGGLTFLAILQAIECCRKLVPRIETPQHNSELHTQSIGALIAERIKYGVPVLNIVKLGLVGDGITCESNTVSNIKKLIQKMTCVEPMDRLTAAQVVLGLEQVVTLKKQFQHRMQQLLTVAQPNKQGWNVSLFQEKFAEYLLFPEDQYEGVLEAFHLLNILQLKVQSLHECKWLIDENVKALGEFRHLRKGDNLA